MLERLHGYLTRRKAPGWFVLIIVVMLALYEAVDFISNVDFIADNFSWVRTIVEFPLTPLAALAFALWWLLFVGNQPTPLVASATPPSETPRLAVPQRRSRTAASAVSDGIRWIEDMQCVDDMPRIRPHCNAVNVLQIHLVPYRPRTKTFEELGDLHRVGVYDHYEDPWQLWCPGLDDHKPHRVGLAADKEYAEAYRVAQMKVRAKREQLRDEMKAQSTIEE